MSEKDFFDYTLREVKEECIKHYKCDRTCPFCIKEYDSCVFMDLPMEWAEVSRNDQR